MVSKDAVPFHGDQWFESVFLQRRVCEPSVPERRSPFDPGPQPGPSSTREGLRRANELAPDFPGFIGRGVDVDIPFAAFQLTDLRVRQYCRALDRAG